MTKALERDYDGIIIGAGHHGMVLGSYLARAGLKILLVERRLTYGGGLCTMEATKPGFYHNLHSINHFHISETPWFKDLGLDDRVTYITPRYEFGQPHLDVLGVNHGRNRIQFGFRPQEAVDEKGLRHRPGIGEAGRLHDDRVEISAFGEKAVHRANQVATNRAADAAIVHFEQFFIRVQDQLVVDADLAEFVDDDGVLPAVVLGQDAVQQGGLAGAKVAGQNRHRDQAFLLHS